MTDRIPFSGTALGPHACTLGEGPTYDPATDTAFWFDIVERRLHEHDFGRDRQIVHELPFMASALATIDAERQLVAAEDGLYVRERASGRLTLHTPLEANNKATRSNDGRVHPSGALWIGTMGKAAEPRTGAIYRFHRGELSMLFPEIGIPNAISFSPDGTVAYFADTKIDTVFRVAVDPETGTPVGEQSVFLAPGHDTGSPDGAVVDQDGVLWNARWGGAALTAYDPGGRKLREIALPASQPTCPAFIGAGADRMLVTSATQDLSPDTLAEEPQAGRTFVLDVPVKGRFEPPVAL